MLHWALTFMIFAIVAALFGFTGLAATAVGTSKLLFHLFLCLLGASLIFRLAEGAVAR